MNNLTSIIQSSLVRTHAAWEVVQGDDYWSLVWDRGTVRIGTSRLPIGIATDAACEFMDRARERNIPTWCTTPFDLMSFCLQEARRQR